QTLLTKVGWEPMLHTSAMGNHFYMSSPSKLLSLAFDDVSLTIGGDGGETVNATQIIQWAIKRIPSVSANTTPVPPATKPAPVDNPRPTAKGPAKIAHLVPKKPVHEHKKPAADKTTRSFADALRSGPKPQPSICHDIGLVEMAQAFPSLLPERIASMHRLANAQELPAKCRPSSTMTGPTRHQIIIPTSNSELTLDVATTISEINQLFIDNKRSIRVTTVRLAYGGLNLSTSLVPDQRDLDLVTKFVIPSIIGSTDAIVPRSRSFLKILDVPYPVTKDVVTQALAAASEPPIGLAAQPRIMHNSKHSDTATVWFDVWDSQSGANVKKLNGQYVTIGSSRCVIWPAKA
ncbi:hypothetical protein AN958_09639, partial [Leucoagaricus sp. SymC.cos]